MLAATGPVHAQSIVNFDDQAAAAVQAAMRSGSYAGLTWGNEGWAVFTNGGRLGNPCHSNPQCASPNAVDPAGRGIGTFSFTGGSQVFFGAWLAGVPAALNSRSQAFFELLVSGVVVHTSATLQFTNDTPTWLSSGYAGAVDQVRLVNTGVFIDDITFGTVPEPTGLLLTAAGMLFLFVAARRRREWPRRGRAHDTIVM